MTDFYVPVRVNSEDLFDGFTKDLTRDELVEFVKDLDLRVAEVEFTQELVEQLLTSLKSDIMNQDSLDTVSAFLTDLGNLKYE